jgi:hypothetical protein
MRVERPGAVSQRTGIPENRYPREPVSQRTRYPRELCFVVPPYNVGEAAGALKRCRSRESEE